MITHTFTKENSIWYLNDTEHLQLEGSDANSALVEGADAILNLVAEGERNVKITFNTEYFDNAESLGLVQDCHPFLEGGYYHMDQHNGVSIHCNIWLCDLIRYTFQYLPEHVFIRKEWAWS